MFCKDICPRCGGLKDEVDKECFDCRDDLYIEEELIPITDTERINFLQKIMVDDAKYTKKCVLRQSLHGRGYRLHESGNKHALDSVRDMIDLIINKQK